MIAQRALGVAIAYLLGRSMASPAEYSPNINPPLAKPKETASASKAGPDALAQALQGPDMQCKLVGDANFLDDGPDFYNVTINCVGGISENGSKNTSKPPKRNSGCTATLHVQVNGTSTLTTSIQAPSDVSQCKTIVWATETSSVVKTKPSVRNKKTPEHIDKKLPESTGKKTPEAFIKKMRKV